MRRGGGHERGCVLIIGNYRRSDHGQRTTGTKVEQEKLSRGPWVDLSSRGKKIYGS